MTLTKSTIERIAKWHIQPERDIASESVVSFMVGNMPAGNTTPQTGESFRRCLLVFELFPEWHDKIGQLSAISRSWWGIVRHWDMLTRLLKSELNDDLHSTGPTPRTDDYLASLTGGHADILLVSEQEEKQLKAAAKHHDKDRQAYSHIRRMHTIHATMISVLVSAMIV